MISLAALVPRPRVKRTGTPSPGAMGYWSCAARPNHRSGGLVTPARRDRGVKSISNAEVRSPTERHAAMTGFCSCKTGIHAIHGNNLGNPG